MATHDIAEDGRTTEPSGHQLLTASAEAFEAACRNDLEAVRARIARLKELAGSGGEGVLEAYDEAGLKLHNVAARANLCFNVHPDAALRGAAERWEQAAASLATELSLDRGVYEALRGLDTRLADGPTGFYAEKELRDFRRAGVDRDPQIRGCAQALQEELVRIGQEFGKNIREDVRPFRASPGELQGVPHDFLASHPVQSDGLVPLTTNNPDYEPVLRYAVREPVREAFFRLYHQRAYPVNLQVLSRMLARRHELATLLGYPHWAEYAAEDKMIGHAAAAAAFIDRIAGMAQPAAAREVSLLLERKRRDDPSAEAVHPWDVEYLLNRFRAERFGVDAAAVRPYFEYAAVKAGMLRTAARLFGLEFCLVDRLRLWHPDVEAYDVVDGARRLGRVYMDMHPRQDKFKHYAQFDLACGHGSDLPEAVLVCNFPKPGKWPALMEYRDVTTFFHEFGHLLHAILGSRTRWAGQSGIKTEWDFVEAPSQLLEEWVRDPDVLAGFARHYQTGEVIPAEMVRRLNAANEFGRGLFVARQMWLAAISLTFHNRNPAGLDLARTVKKLYGRYTPLPFADGTYLHTSFGHLEGYSAVYYTYMWSLVIAKDLVTAWKGSLMDPVVGRRYRERVLEAGGSKPAAALVEDFLGRPYSFAAYEAWLDAALKEQKDFGGV